MSKRTVLLVDDDERIVQFTSSVLKKLDCTVLPALSTQEALQICDTYKDEISLLLSDVIMPGLKAESLLKYVRSKHPEIKAIFMSGFSDKVLRDHGLSEEDVNFLRKPFTVEELREKVSQT